MIGVRALSGSLTRRIALFYAALFIAVFGAVIAVASAGIDRYVGRVLAQEMASSASVFDRIWRERYDQMASGAAVLSSDFGFRSAISLGDEATITSALDSLKGRLGIATAFVVTSDGRVVGIGATGADAQVARIFNDLEAGVDRGIMTIGGQLHGAVAAPVRAPDTIGWVIFAEPLDAADMADLAKLSSVPVAARVLGHKDLPARLGDRASAAVPLEVEEGGETLIYRSTALPSFGGAGEPRLVLRYSLSAATAEYRPMLWILAGVALAGLLLTLYGSLLIARGIVRPIRTLEQAARRVSAGESATVDIRSGDEIGALAKSFNYMVEAIADRESKITHIALHDSLTDLPNRKLFREQLDIALRRIEGKGRVAVLYLDLDNFKAINDTLGHPTGDGVLRMLGARLAEAMSRTTVARFGGDEFAVLIEDRDGTADFGAVARRITGCFDRPFAIDGQEILSGTSIGIAIAPQDGDEVDQLIKNADLALYRAKQEGRGIWRFFEATMDAQARERRSMEIDLRAAIPGQQFELYFQPLFNLARNEISAFEALLRWNHPTRGLVSPLDFIGLAEESGLILPIGEWALREACRHAVTWPDHVRVAVNVSPVQFKSTGLNAMIVQALAASGLAPNRLEIEVTESLFIENVETTLASLHSLRALGVRVALDDFGTGYSSLSYLRSFPFDKIKIDRSFIVDLLSRDGSTAIIRSITALAEALGMETTAEGVEDVEQVEILRAQGCSQIQGYLLSRPVPQSQVAGLIAMLSHDQLRRAA